MGKSALTALAFCLAVLSPTLFAQQKPKVAIDWQRGPTVGNLGNIAQVQVPEGYLFTDKKGAQKLLELTQNIPSGNEVGALIPATGEHTWFVTFEFTEIGYVKDDEKDQLDADAILKSMSEATEGENKARADKGWPAFHVVGWEKPPYYDPITHNLTWAIIGKDDKGVTSVNHSVRILGRKGTMNVDLVLDEASYSAVLPTFANTISGLSFSEGNRYADFVSGDKVASYGLTALIAGGAGAVALKTGLLAKAWKAILVVVLALKKLILVLFAGIAAAFKRFWAWITRRKSKDQEQSDTSGVFQSNEEAGAVTIAQKNE